MMQPVSVRMTVMSVLLAVPSLMVLAWVNAAAGRLTDAKGAPEEREVAVAQASDEGYCTPELKKILRRVLQSCGLLGRGSTRGCQPLEAKKLATLDGGDFNALFMPMRNRGGIVQFDAGKAVLDADDEALVEQVFADQRGASYFFVVARSSPDGPMEFNRELSKSRAETVLAHLTDKFEDPDLEREVGLLWLGEEYAQLDREYCDWRRSGSTERCTSSDINRGAFVAWIDCRL